MNSLVIYQMSETPISKLIPGTIYDRKPIPNLIKMKPISYKDGPDPDICLICQDSIEDGHRITMCEQCKIYLHYRCQLEWLYFYNPAWNRSCCHCKRTWEADYSTIQIVKNGEEMDQDKIKEKV